MKKGISFVRIDFLVLSAALFLMATAAFNAHGQQAVVLGFNDNILEPNDDGSTELVDIGFEINFFGVVSSSLYVNNNGNVTLDQPLFVFTPFDLTSTGQQIIAPFFADVDTRSAGDPVTYGNGFFNGRPAFGVNWVNVDYFPSDPAHTNRNSFQLILVDRSDIQPGEFDIVFNYDQIQWEAGTASGSNDAGRGGFSARVGFSNGTGEEGTFFELRGSAINGAFLDTGSRPLIFNRINSTIDGRYIFRARNGDITPPPPAPASAITWHNTATGDTRIWSMEGVARVGTSSPPGIPDTSWSLIGTADFSGDGRYDFLWRAADLGLGQNRIWLIADNQRLAASAIPSIANDWSFGGTGDFNGDGRDDILWRQTLPVTGQNRAWLMNGLQRQQGDSIPLLRGSEWIAGGIGDFNGDGRDDILWRSTQRPQTRIWIMDTFDRVQSAAIPLIQNQWEVAGIGDFDGDGKADILWRNGAIGQNRIWLMDGLTIKGRGTINLIGPASWQVAGVDDFDADGRDDIVWRNSDSGQNRIWLMDGLARKQGAAIPFEPDTNWRIAGVGNTD